MPFSVGLGEQLMILVVGVMTLALPIAIVVLLVRVARRPAPDPRALLAERLAKGEITRDEFDTAMRALGAPGEARHSG